MLNDFEMVIRKFPREDIKIYPVYDVHLGAQEHMTRAWELFCQRVVTEPNSFVILGGDLINNATRSSVSNIFEETLRPREQKKIMTEMLKPIAAEGKLLCATKGNHERRSGKDADDDVMYDIMAKLDCEHLYRENIVFLKLQFGNSKGDGLANPTYSLVVTHGAGGGMLTGGAVNRAERFGYVLDGADALIVGHTHKPFLTQPGKIKIDLYNNKVSVKPFKVITATPWMEWGGYAAQKMLLPTSFAPQVVHVCGTRKELTVQM